MLFDQILNIEYPEKLYVSKKSKYFMTYSDFFIVIPPT